MREYGEFIVMVHYPDEVYCSPYSNPFRGEVVRCRDCNHSTNRWSAYHGEEVTYCERFVHLSGYNQSAYVEPDGFCAWGVKGDSDE